MANVAAPPLGGFPLHRITTWQLLQEIVAACGRVTLRRGGGVCRWVFEGLRVSSGSVWPTAAVKQPITCHIGLKVRLVAFTMWSAYRAVRNSHCSGWPGGVSLSSTSYNSLKGKQMLFEILTKSKFSSPKLNIIFQSHFLTWKSHICDLKSPH